MRSRTRAALAGSGRTQQHAHAHRSLRVPHRRPAPEGARRLRGRTHEAVRGRDDTRTRHERTDTGAESSLQTLAVELGAHLARPVGDDGVDAEIEHEATSSGSSTVHT